MTEKFEHRAIQLKVVPFAVTVKADRNQLMQVLIHLVNHAVKDSVSHEPITLKLDQTDKWAVIQVRDRGCGFLLQQSRIFEPFYRVDQSRTRFSLWKTLTRTTGGAGLGLSVTKYLVEGMGGRIIVQSQPGEDSSFIVTLPAQGAKL